MASCFDGCAMAVHAFAVAAALLIMGLQKPRQRPTMHTVCSARRALYFLEPMLLEPGLGTSAGERDHLASDEPNASLPLPT